MKETCKGKTIRWCQGRGNEMMRMNVIVGLTMEHGLVEAASTTLIPRLSLNEW